MKKILSLVLCAVMLVSACLAFASCGGGTAKTKVIDLKLTEEEYAFAVRKGDSELLSQLNDFMAEIKDNGKFDEIIDKYFGDGTPTPVTSAAAAKHDGSQLIVATNAAFEPFEYKVGQNYYGVDMEIMALFAEKLGRELYIDNMAFDAVCLSVSSAGGTYVDENGETVSVAGGTCDIAAAGLTVNEKRMEILDFSSTYYDASQMVIVKEDDTLFDACTTAAEVENVLKSLSADVKVGVQNGTTGNLYCKGDEDWGFEGFGFTTVGYATGALAIQDLINGGCRIVVLDEAPAKAIVAKMNEVN